MTNFEQELETHGSIIYTNRGVSMLPLLRQDRDILVIEKRGEERCRKYDAVLFKRDNGQYILHRILKLLDGGYYIVGDNCAEGELVREDQVLGVLRSVRRNGKTIQVTDPGYRFYVRVLRPIHRARVCLRRFVIRTGSFVKRRILRIK
jgi:hypothetical protein